MIFVCPVSLSMCFFRITYYGELKAMSTLNGVRRTDSFNDIMDLGELTPWSCQLSLNGVHSQFHIKRYEKRFVWKCQFSCVYNAKKSVVDDVNVQGLIKFCHLCSKSTKFCAGPRNVLNRWTGCPPRSDSGLSFIVYLWSTKFYSGPLTFFQLVNTVPRDEFVRALLYLMW